MATALPHRRAALSMSPANGPYFLAATNDRTPSAGPPDSPDSRSTLRLCMVTTMLSAFWRTFARQAAKVFTNSTVLARADPADAKSRLSGDSAAQVGETRLTGTMRRLNSMDNLFLKQENGTQPQHTIKAVVLDPAAAHQPLTFDAVRAVVPALVEKVEPLRWQLLRPRLGGRPWWIDRPKIDLGYHVNYARVDSPGGDRELAAQISEIVSVGLDGGRPAWQLWYIDGLAGGRIALVLKLHHALADGLASVRLLETIFSTDPAEPLPIPGRTSVDEQRPKAATWLRSLAIHEGAAMLRFPRVLVRSAQTIGTVRRRRKASRPGFAQAFAAPGTRFNRRFTVNRQFAYVRCDMATIKEIKSAFGVTLNDVFLAGCSGAIRSYLDRHGELPAESLTTVVPVAIRPPGEEVDWGNQVTIWNVSLATDVADPSIGSSASPPIPVPQGRCMPSVISGLWATGWITGRCSGSTLVGCPCWVLWRGGAPLTA